MAVTLVLRSGSTPAPAAGDEEPGITYDTPRIVIGRGDSCDLRIPDPSVSHRHASVRQRGSEYILVDEGSTNGTFIGSVRLSPQSPRVLRHGELIRVGRVWLELRIEFSATSGSTAQATKELALALVAQALDAQGQEAGPRLVIVDGPDTGKEASLRDAARPVVLGRGRDADVPLDLAEASRRHARVARQGDAALLRDLGSRIGTSSKNEPVAADRDTVLRPGDTFEIGPDVIRYEFPAAEALRELERAEDERMAPNEPVTPPEPGNTAKDEPPPSPDAHEPESTSTQRRKSTAPQSQGRTSVPQRRPAQQEGGWSKTDVVIVLLALGVLAISAVGLVWLFRGM